MMRGSSTADLIFLRNVTPSLPSIRRWSYVSATYIIGLISTYNTGARCDSVRAEHKRPQSEAALRRRQYGVGPVNETLIVILHMHIHDTTLHHCDTCTCTATVHHCGSLTSRALTSLAHLAVDGDGPVEDAVHAEDGGLRRVDDGRAEHAAVDAAVADRERAARHVLHRDLVLPRLRTAQQATCRHAHKPAADSVDVDSTHTQWISSGVILATLLDHMNSIHVLGVMVFLRVRNYLLST